MVPIKEAMPINNLGNIGCSSYLSDTQFYVALRCFRMVLNGEIEAAEMGPLLSSGAHLEVVAKSL